MVTEITTAASPRRLPTVARVVLGARAMAGSMLMPSYTCMNVEVNGDIDNGGGSQCVMIVSPQPACILWTAPW